MRKKKKAPNGLDRRLGKPLKVRQLRQKLHLSRDEFAVMIGASSDSIGRWERGLPVSPRYQPKVEAMIQAEL